MQRINTPLLAVGLVGLCLCAGVLCAGDPCSTRVDERHVVAQKAVAKQNLTATLLLSDLYLRGDGVTKSCDQAHLLLDAAARKGASAAGERLRNLQAFGCR